MVRAKQIITEAKKLIGVPFCHFGRSTLGIDCSGLVWMVHHRCGIDFPRSDRPYNALWWRNSKEERILNGFQKCWKFELVDRPIVGGLVLFRIFGKNVPINHCGILINEHQFIHAKCGIGHKINKTCPDNLESGYSKRIAGYMIRRDICYD